MCLKWLRQQSPPCPWNRDTTSHAAATGSLEILQWARSQDPKCPWNEDTCDGASQRGHLETLKWCRQQDPPCPWFPNEVLLNAAAGGYLDMIKVRPKTKTEIPPPRT